MEKMKDAERDFFHLVPSLGCSVGDRGGDDEEENNSLFMKKTLLGWCACLVPS